MNYLGDIAERSLVIAEKMVDEFKQKDIPPLIALMACLTVVMNIFEMSDVEDELKKEIFSHYVDKLRKNFNEEMKNDDESK
jgi:hypothetical protein